MAEITFFEYALSLWWMWLLAIAVAIHALRVIGEVERRRDLERRVSELEKARKEVPDGQAQGT